MASNQHADDVTIYAATVRARLADLPATERDALLEDLEQHLAEVAAEGEGSLVDRLGPPEGYAAELRAAYGAAQPSVPAAQTNGEHLVDIVQAAAARIIAADWLRQIAAFLPDLRPAWWVLRGYLAALILTAAFSVGYGLGPIPNPITKRGLAEILAMGIAIWLSVRLGRRSLNLRQGVRFLAVSANVLIALVAVGVLGQMHTFTYNYSDVTGNVTLQQAPFNAAFAAGPTTNIYPYSQDGKPLTNILLYDQDGQPITVEQSEAQTSYPTGADGRAITNAYPLTQRHLNGDPVVAPRVAFPPWPAPSPSPSASPSPTPNPSPTR